MSRRSPQSESGFILLVVLFMVVLVLIALAVAVPRIAADIQRDKEDELIHRGKQYIRALKLYNKKFGNYPSSISQLENSNNIRFLRKRYVDPMTGKDDWRIIHLGEAKIKPMGLFGQALQSSSLAATTGNTVPSTTSGTGTTPLGGASPLGGGSTFSSSPTPTTGSTGTDSSASSGASGTSSTGSTSPFSSGPGSGTGTSPFGSSSSGTSTFGSSGQTFGGAPMVGIASKSTKASIKEYKKQKHYNEWEFVYDPVEDLLSSVSIFGGGGTSVNGTTGTGLNGTSNPGTSSPFSSGPTSGTGFGGTTPTPTPTPIPTPTQPQQ